MSGPGDIEPNHGEKHERLDWIDPAPHGKWYAAVNAEEPNSCVEQHIEEWRSL